MALSDILQAIGGGFKTGGQDILQGLQAAAPVAAKIGIGGGQALGNALQAQGNPLAFQAQQQQLMEKMREDFASKQGGMLTAFQQAQLHQQDQARQDANSRWLAQMHAEGAIEPAQAGEEGALEVGGNFFKPSDTPMITPPAELQSILGTNPIRMNKLDPGVQNLIGDYVKTQFGKKKATMGLPTALSQLDTIFPPDAGEESAKQNAMYKQQIQMLAQQGDTTRMDTLMDTLVDADRKEKMAVKQSGEIRDADEEAGMRRARIDLPDKVLKFNLQQIMLGNVSEAEATRNLGISDKFGRRRWAQFLAENNVDLPKPLSPPAQKDLRSIVTVNDSLKKLMAMLEPYKDSDSPAEMLIPRLRYKLGIGDDKTGLISLGEMDDIRGAAQSLTGIRTGFGVLERALIHTPDFWKDSGKNMYEKAKNMSSYLDDQESNVYKFGAKTGVIVPRGKEGYMGGQGEPATPKPRKYINRGGVMTLNPDYKE